MVTTKDEILSLLKERRAEFESRFKVRKLALFGSYSRGDQTPESDVDILVDVSPSVGLEFVTLAERIEEILGRHVDLVSVRAMKPRMRETIEGELIYV